MDRYFNVLDEDKNGAIDINELEMWIEKSYRSNDKTRAEEKLRSCDENSDGYLSFEEHLQCTFGLSSEELVYRVDPNLETIVRVAKAEQVRFNGVDRNKDGKLSRSELVMFLSPQNYHSMADVELQVGLTRYDTNHDGIVTLDEFLSTSGTQNSNELDDLVDQFAKLDKNHDNRLTVDELKQWLFPNASSMAAVEAKNIFAIIDADNDGKISVPELRSRTSAFAHETSTSYPGTPFEEF
ncbi:EF hand, partial [Opisthorchis viverrini]